MQQTPFFVLFVLSMLFALRFVAWIFIVFHNSRAAIRVIAQSLSPGWTLSHTSIVKNYTKLIKYVFMSRVHTIEHMVAFLKSSECSWGYEMSFDISLDIPLIQKQPTRRSARILAQSKTENFTTQ
jgi:hypothetical protein